jgi:hypothetical protein
MDRLTAENLKLPEVAFSLAKFFPGNDFESSSDKRI